MLKNDSESIHLQSMEYMIIRLQVKNNMNIRATSNG